MIESDNKTIWCGNLPDQVTEELLYELFLQAGPLARVRIARDRDGRYKNFAFITYIHEVSVPYALNLLQGTSLFHRTLSLQCRGQMALLPPPIRCYGPDTNLDLSNQPYVVQKFAEMSQNINQQEQFGEVSRQWESNDKLIMASLQGNWSHRHHPYRPKDLSHNRDNFRSRENYDGQRSREKPWRDRRHHKRSNYHR